MATSAHITKKNGASLSRSTSIQEYYKHLIRLRTLQTYSRD